MSQAQVKRVIFSHVVLQGTAYQVGRFQANLVKTMPGFVEYLRSGQGKFSDQEFEKVLKRFDRYCPGGVNEEIQGLADGLDMPVGHVAYYAHTYLRTGNCSHFAVLPAVSEKQHVLVGRSYEFGDTADDLRLCSTHIDGQYAHIGFSTILFGRNEGMNEHGLAVTMSAGGLPVGTAHGLRPPIQDGVQFWALVRSILEQCQTVDEAVQLINEVPLCGNPNLIVADKAGNAALVEVFGPHKAIKRIDEAGPEKYICSTNHFTMPETGQHDPGVTNHSKVRYQTIRSHLDKAAPQINKQTLKTLLSTRYPDGLCCHFYDEFFGTLHSIVFDLTAGDLEVCFGSPLANTWHHVDFSFSLKANHYEIKLPQEKADPSFWAQTM